MVIDIFVQPRVRGPVHISINECANNFDGDGRLVVDS